MGTVDLNTRTYACFEIQIHVIKKRNQGFKNQIWILGSIPLWFGFGKKRITSLGFEMQLHVFV